MPTTDTPPSGDHPAPRTQLVLTALLVALYAAVRLWRLTATCLWFDEIFSVHAARHAWAGLWSFAAADLIHPPLFYALLKLWAAGGESLLWLRLFPALTSLLALVPFFLLARELGWSRAETNAALLLTAANGYLIKYAQELRMYSLLLLLTLASLWLFVKFLKSAGVAARLLLALGLVNLLLVYTHYYGWVVVACEAAFLLFKERCKLPRFLLTVAALALLFAPWAAACLKASREGGGLSQNLGWIERPGASELAQVFALFNEPFYFQQSSAQPLYARGGALLGLLLVGLPILALLARSLRRAKDAERVGHEGEPKRDSVIFLVFFALLPVVLALAASRVLPFSVWGTRHLIVAAAPYLLLAGVALVSLRPLWLRAFALILVCCWLLAVGALTLTRSEGEYVWCAWENLVRSALRDEGAAGEARTGEGDETQTDVGVAPPQPASGVTTARQPVNLYAFEDLVAYHLWFALDTSRETGMKVVVLKGMPGTSEDPAYFLPRRFDGVASERADALGGERFWVAFRDADWDESRPPLSALLGRGYRAARIYETAAQGQRAFLVLFTRDGRPR